MQDNPQPTALDPTQPNFCQECGLHLTRPDTFCTSRECNQCGKEVFFIRRGEEGGIKVEAGDKLLNCIQN